MKETYVKRVNAFLSGFLEKEGYTLLLTEFVKEDGIYYLRVYIDLTEAERDKRRAAFRADPGTDGADPIASADPIALAPDPETPESGTTDAEGSDGPEEEIPEPAIGVNDCARVSRRLSKWLDQEDFIDETYTLEVCSSGFLKTEE